MGGARTRGGDGRQHSAALPRAYPDPEGQPDPHRTKTFALEVDGEQFAVRLVVNAATGYTDTGYTWLSGPNKGYGFAIGGPPNPSLEDHRQRIREFLAMVDPTTGFIEDDWTPSSQSRRRHLERARSLGMIALDQRQIRTLPESHQEGELQKPPSRSVIADTVWPTRAVHSSM